MVLWVYKGFWCVVVKRKDNHTVKCAIVPQHWFFPPFYTQIPAGCNNKVDHRAPAIYWKRPSGDYCIKLLKKEKKNTNGTVIFNEPEEPGGF